MFADITSFIAELDRRGELSRVAEPVNPFLEISAVIDRATKSPGGGPALVFERPTGSSMPVAANLFGSMSRVCGGWAGGGGGGGGGGAGGGVGGGGGLAAAGGREPVRLDVADVPRSG